VGAYWLVRTFFEIAICQGFLYNIHMKLFNTLTRSKDEFKPMDGETAKIYSCGPTVYNTAHIGNLRAYIFVDILKRAIELKGFKLFDVMNSTDVGHLVEELDEQGKNKVEEAARKAGTTPDQIAQKYTEEFWQHAGKLNIRRPKIFAPATQYVDDMIKFVMALEKKGLTYVISDGVYFDSSKFEDYNKLSRMPIDKLKAGARIDIGERRNPHDFVLWKFIDEKSMQKWKSPWSKHGCPGWHIECSAIARHHLGDTFDIHTGGVDHIPIHHTNEIAQTESITGKPMSNFFLHNEFITVDGGKMSKSLGNVYTIDDIVARGFDPLAFRYYCLLSHYRSILNFTWEGLKSAQTAYDNLIELLARHKNAEYSSEKFAEIKKTTVTAKQTLMDDLNTAKLIAGIWDLVKKPPLANIFYAVIAYDQVLGLDLVKRTNEYLKKKNKKSDVPKEIVDLANKRMQAKSKKDFAAADQIRKQIEKRGYNIVDTKEGYEINLHS